MRTLGVILGRAGSKGLPGKNVADVAGRPMIAWTIDHARAAESLDELVVSTDGEAIADVARAMGVRVIDRPDELAGDTATVDAAARHAVEALERETGADPFDAVVILYANVPVRPAELIDTAMAKLAESGCDSVQSVCPVGKGHPYWMKKLGGESGDAIQPYEPNRVYRRQDLPAVYALDGGLIAVRREALFKGADRKDEPHAFLGRRQRGIVTEAGSVVDVDTAADLAVADAMLQREQGDGGGVMIGGRVVGDTGRTYVIAELGVNHDGSLERAMALAESAKAAGADAIKVQVFNADRLLSRQAELAAYQENGEGEHDVAGMLEKLQLDEPALAQLRQWARELELGFIATCFSVDDAATLARLGVDAVKIASPDAVNGPLLEAVAAALPGAPLLISTGACTEDEVRTLRLRLASIARGQPAVLMHCVSSYPTESADAQLRWIGRLEGPGTVAGYSDHTTEVEAGMLAVSCGARVIEKHLTYDRAAAGPDHAASFDGEQFAQYVSLIRKAECMLGSGGERRVLEAEQDVRRVARQSVCLTRAMAKGQVIGREDVTIKRPGTGIPAERLSDVVGATLRRDVEANSLLAISDLLISDF